MENRDFMESNESAEEKNMGDMGGTETGEKVGEPEAKDYQEVEIFGIPALFDNARILPEDVPEGLYRYDLRGSDYDPGDPVTVEAHVGVNHAASILTVAPLPIPERGFLRIGEELNFVGGMASVRGFMEENHGLDMDSLMENMENAICHENEDVFLAPSAGTDRYAIYQLNEKAEGDSYLFMGMEEVKRMGMEVKGGDYSLVYGGRLAEHENPDTLFEKFNIAHPEGFTGHSLSVSDVVVINRGGNVEAYYVDPFGFTILPEFVGERQEMPAPEMEEGMEGLMVKGHFGTWHSIDSVEVKGETFFLMESDEYGDTVSNIAVNGEGELVAEDLEHGFDGGFYEAVAEYIRNRNIARWQGDAGYPAVYPHTPEYAAEHGESEVLQDSHKFNIACKEDIEDAIKEHFDGTRLNHDAAKFILEEYGAERTAYVLSATVQQKAWDGRFSKSNREWAAETHIPENMVMGTLAGSTTHQRCMVSDINADIIVESHPAVLNEFIGMFRKELKEREKSAGQEHGQEPAGEEPKKQEGPRQEAQGPNGGEKSEPTIPEAAGETEPERVVPEPGGKTERVLEIAEPAGAAPELEDGDEIIDLGDEREEVLAQMRGILGDSNGEHSDSRQTEGRGKLAEMEKTELWEKEQAEPQETELAFRIADRYISIHGTDGGYDYTIYGLDYKEIDGGVYESPSLGSNPNRSIREAADEIVDDLKHSPSNGGVRGNIRDEDEVVEVDFDELEEKAEEANRIEPMKTQGGIIADFRSKTEELFHSISDMNPSEIEETVKCHVQAKIDETGIDAVIVDAVLVGSRCRGLEKQHSDIDVVVELETVEREDTMFDSFNEDSLSIGGIKVDINPITAQRTGTLETYLPQAEEYLDGARRARESEPASLFRIRMCGEERWFKNTSGLDARGLCRAYAECDRPFVEMGQYGNWIEPVEYAVIEQGDTFDFSVEFNDETHQIIIFDGEHATFKQMRETLFLSRMEDDPDAAAELAVKIYCLSYDYDNMQYQKSTESMEENVSEIAASIRQGDTGHLTAWLANIISEGAVPEETERALELLTKLNDYKPLAKIEEAEEQNYNMVDNVLNNGAGEKARKEENKREREKSARRASLSLKDRLAEKKALVSGQVKEYEGRENSKKNQRERSAYGQI